VDEIIIRGREIRWPPCCACCLAPAETTLEQEARKTTELIVARVERSARIRVPYCRACAQHVTWHRGSIGPGCLVGLACIAGFFLGYAIMAGRIPVPEALSGLLTLASLIGLPVLVGLGGRAWRRRSKPPDPLPPPHATPRDAVWFGFTKDSLVLNVENKEFGRRLRELNPS
jgi:hypothetical protein